MRENFQKMIKILKKVSLLYIKFLVYNPFCDFNKGNSHIPFNLMRASSQSIKAWSKSIITTAKLGLILLETHSIGHWAQHID